MRFIRAERSASVMRMLSRLCRLFLRIVRIRRHCTGLELFGSAGVDEDEHNFQSMRQANIPWPLDSFHG